ncbi:MAG: AraC family transcriptional regulator, partial [Clostridia bacterium]|nr:AraC family transcriptional regulator [Clostridia bacterium]
MLFYSIITTLIIIIFVFYSVYLTIQKQKHRKLDSLFYEDFFDLVPKFNHNFFSEFIRSNTFIVSVLTNRFDSRFQDIPDEKTFVKNFKKAFPKDVNIHYTYKNAYLSFVVSFDFSEDKIISILENMANNYPTMYFGLSQCLKKDMIFSSIKNNKSKGMHKILSSKFAGNSRKAANMGLFNKKNVYRFDVSENKLLPSTSIEIESKLLVAFKCRNIDDTSNIILKAFENTENYSQCMYIANNLLFFLHNILTKNNISIADVYGDNVNLYRWVSGTTHKKGLIETMQSWFKKAVIYIEEHSDKINDIELRIEKYIEENYTKEISTTTMAEEFGVSPQYFSKYFKFQTGNNFLDTVNRYRIKKALEMINNTTLPMVEIATMTGFNNYKSFSRNFKKYTGKIPSEYT